MEPVPIDEPRISSLELCESELDMIKDLWTIKRSIYADIEMCSNDVKWEELHKKLYSDT